MNIYIPNTGDLLFQDLQGDLLADAVTDVTSGYQGQKISHVGIAVVEREGCFVLEATEKGVLYLPLAHFLSRSLDGQGEPRVLVARLHGPYQGLIEGALNQAIQWRGYPYNASFTPYNQGGAFYCSQLIAQAFAMANGGVAIFKANPMSFSLQGRLTPRWASYFTKINKPIPEGEMGTNPAMMSMDPILYRVHQYGQLSRIPI